MISLSLVRGFLIKEFKQVLRDSRMRFILFVAPIIQLFLFGVAISTDVKNIRLWSNVNNTDYVLQHVYERSVGSKWFMPAARSGEAEPYALLRGKKIDAALVPPPGGLTKALGYGAADLQLLIDATNVIQAQSVEAYVKNIVTRAVLEDLKIEPVASPINFVARVLFNPMLETTYFMVPGVMCLLMCVASVVLTNASISKEKERGTFEMLISAPISSTEVILGKTLPYVIIAMADFPLILLAAIAIFGVPMRGSVLILFFAALAFVCSTVAIGTLISTFTKNQQQSMLGGVLFIFPAILLSGLMFPIENMPTFMRLVSYCNPLSHFLLLLRNIMLKGGETNFILFHVGVLLLMAIIFVCISFKRFHTTLR